MRKERGKEHTPRKNPKKIQQKKRHQFQLNLKRTETTDETPPVRGKLKKELKPQKKRHLLHLNLNRTETTKETPPATANFKKIWNNKRNSTSFIYI